MNSTIAVARERQRKMGDKYFSMLVPLLVIICMIWISIASLNNVNQRMKEIGIDVKKLLHASEEYEYFSQIYPGDKIIGVVKVDSLRSGGAMDIATFQSTYTREGEVVLIAKMKIVVMTGEE